MSGTEPTTNDPNPFRIETIWEEERPKWHAAVFLIIAGTDLEHSDALLVVHGPHGRTVRTFTYDDHALPACARALDVLQQLSQSEAS